jgi:basic membrane lipoprotein Med (substrate-binding protein (PBP1-ABC) superfamily)
MKSLKEGKELGFLENSISRRAAVKLCGLALAAVAGLGLFAEAATAQEKLKVAGIYTVPIQQKWAGTLHRALVAAKERGEIEYNFSEKVANTDYVRVMPSMRKAASTWWSARPSASAARPARWPTTIPRSPS